MALQVEIEIFKFYFLEIFFFDGDLVGIDHDDLVSEFVVSFEQFLENGSYLRDRIAEKNAGNEYENNAINLLILILGSKISVSNGEGSDGTPIERHHVFLPQLFVFNVVKFDPVRLNLVVHLVVPE